MANDGYIYDDAAETATVWAAAQGCDADGATPYATTSDGTRDWACTEHAGCASGAEVVTCVWDGGHTWPTRGEHGNFVLEAIWDFLSSHRRTSGS